VISHGSPERNSGLYVDPDGEASFQMTKLPFVRWCSPCSIYLSTCNSGTGDPRGPVAQAVADLSGCNVYGTRGYTMSDMSHFLGNMATTKTVMYLEVLRPAYPGSADATGDKAWNLFRKDQPVSEPQ
jgi:hypothetical protein